MKKMFNTIIVGALISSNAFSSGQSTLCSKPSQLNSQAVAVLAGPYVSGLLLKTLETKKLTTLNLSTDPKVDNSKLNTLPADHFFEKIRCHQHNAFPLIINSEFAQSIVGDSAADSAPVHYASFFRDKAKFREWLSDVYPDFFFKQGSIADFKNITQADNIPYPVIIKPATGYLSLCVYKATSFDELKAVLADLEKSYEKLSKDYPSSMLNCDKLIMEHFIAGPEVAVEGYFNAQGEPVILNIMARTFKDANDTSDVIYYTSKAVMLEYMEPVKELLTRMVEKTPFQSFPFIAELRVDETTGKLIPIELNPLRFSGNCIDELSHYAYGVNNYDYFFEQKAPDWVDILAKNDGAVYGTFGAAIPAHVEHGSIQGVKDDELKAQFSEILDYRSMLSTSKCVYSIVFYRAVDPEENTRLINLNLESYIIKK